MTTENPLRAEHFRRVDESPDDQFYREARLVTHIDDAAIAATTAFYRDLLPANGRILDLMSSWVSHLPADVEYAAVAGLGMNAAELDANARLTDRVVQDLNDTPELPWDDGSFDAAVVTVSVQYLTRPAEVFAEVGRVLAGGAPFAVLYSNRCFPTKAVAVWQTVGTKDHADLIGLYFRLSGAFGPPRAYDLSPSPGKSDPLYGVVAGRLGGGKVGGT
ncbi:MAG: class I SAM-dependent methyltransferase [Dehalococcoidia bacterium]